MSMNVVEELAPWDKVALTRPHVVPVPLDSSEIVAVDLDKVPTVADDDEEARGLTVREKGLLITYQGLDWTKLEWTCGRKREFVPCRATKKLKGKRINLDTGELVGKSGYHVHMVKNQGNGYFKVNNVLWHVEVEMEYQRRRFKRTYDRNYNWAKGTYKTRKYQVHHRYEALKGTSFGNSLMALALVPTYAHIALHVAMRKLADDISGDINYRATVCVPMNTISLRNFAEKLAHDPQGEGVDTPKPGYFARKDEKVEGAA